MTSDATRNFMAKRDAIERYLLGERVRCLHLSVDGSLASAIQEVGDKPQLLNIIKTSVNCPVEATSIPSVFTLLASRWRIEGETCKSGGQLWHRGGKASGFALQVP